MDTCVVCGLTSDDPTLFTGHDPVVCIACHLELCEDRPQMRTISIEDFKVFSPKETGDTAP